MSHPQFKAIYTRPGLAGGFALSLDNCQIPSVRRLEQDELDGLAISFGIESLIVNNARPLRTRPPRTLRKVFRNVFGTLRWRATSRRRLAV